MGLLVGVEAAKVGSPDVTDFSHDILKDKCVGKVILKSIFKEALVDGFLTRISGQQKVGEEYEGGHSRADHSGWKGLPVMHEESKLGVGIGEINPLFLHETEVFQDLLEGLFLIFLLEPVPRHFGILGLDLIPEPSIESSVEDSHRLGIHIVKVGPPAIKISLEMVVFGHLDVVLRPHRTKVGSSGTIGLSSDGGRHCRCGRMFIVLGPKEFAVDDLINFGHHEDADHLLRPALKVSPIEARDVRDRESGGGLAGRHC